MTHKPTPEQEAAAKELSLMAHDDDCVWIVDRRKKMAAFLAARDARLLAENAALKERVAGLVEALTEAKWLLEGCAVLLNVSGNYNTEKAVRAFLAKHTEESRG